MKSSAALAGAAMLPGATLAADVAASAPAKTLGVGLIGIGGQGSWHLAQLNAIPDCKLVALCDVDANALVNAARKVTDAATFVDFREMLKVPEVEAVLIATPDHTHAALSAAAMRAGKHVYCEKPLTHTVREARTIADLARETGVVTQLGIQVHNWGNYENVVKLIRGGIIGNVAEVHIWNARDNRPADLNITKPPARLNYDLWLGPVPPMPYYADCHPFNWRRYWAFGSGLAGDIGCHFMDLAFWALELKYPTRVEAIEGAPLDDVVTAEWIVSKYNYPARGDKPPVELTWYDPPRRPAQWDSWKIPGELGVEGVMFIGEDGKMLFANYGTHVALPAEKFPDFKPKPPHPAEAGHHQDWIEACLKNDPSLTTAPFSYGGPLTESALLGTVAFRTQMPLEWDAENLRATNAPEADQFISSTYREGWTL